MSQKKYQLHLYSTQLQGKNPITQIEQTQYHLSQLLEQLKQQIHIKMNFFKSKMTTSLSTLHVVSPLATLDRGYAIATKKNKILFTTQQLKIGDNIDVRLAQGTLACKITQIKD